MAIFNSKLLVYQRVEPPCEGHGTAASWKNVFWHDPSSRHCRCSSSGASALRDTLVMAWHERIMDRSWRIEASKEQTLLTLLCWITLFKHPHVKYVWNMYGICKYIYILINIWPAFIAKMEEHIPYREHMGHIDLKTCTLWDMIWCHDVIQFSQTYIQTWYTLNTETKTGIVQKSGWNIVIHWPENSCYPTIAEHFGQQRAPIPALRTIMNQWRKTNGT